LAIAVSGSYAAPGQIMTGQEWLPPQLFFAASRHQRRRDGGDRIALRNRMGQRPPETRPARVAVVFRR
jgi:hypothetical protein